MAANSRNSAWAAYDGRNRREIKQGDRSVLVIVHIDTVNLHMEYMHMYPSVVSE